jgi:molybdenum cofactor biosynthesis enzyme
MRPSDLAGLLAEIAALRAVTEIELKNLNIRLSAVETTQRELVRVATQGKTGLRVLIWLGGLLTAATTAALTFWDNLSGR